MTYGPLLSVSEGAPKRKTTSLTPMIPARPRESRCGFVALVTLPCCSQGMVTSLAVLPSGSLVSGSEDENLMVWNWTTGERLNLLKVRCSSHAASPFQSPPSSPVTLTLRAFCLLCVRGAVLGRARHASLASGSTGART